MALSLNPPVATFEEFYGRNTEQMPKLLEKGMIPMSTAGLMQQRVDILTDSKATQENKDAWWLNYFDTGTGAVRHSKGNMKIVPNAPYLLQLTPQTQLDNGAVRLSDDEYARLDGEEFEPAVIEKYSGKPLSEREVKNNPLWLASAEDNKSLVGEIARATFGQAKERFGYDGKMMGIYVPPVPSSDAAGRLWFVSGLGGGDSRAFGDLHFDSNIGRLVGVALEARAATEGKIVRPTLEQTLAIVNNPDLNRQGMIESVVKLYQQ